MRARRGGVVAVLVLLGAATWPSGAHRPRADGPAAGFSITEAMIPMRDGVKLHTRIFVPVKRTGPLPILLSRTPYGVANAERAFVTSLKALAEDGYIFAFQDIRGKYGSEGVFVMQRPARPPGDTRSLDEGTDTYDTIDWLLANVRGHNGRVGLHGTSYDGWTTMMGTLEPHPALRAAAPKASPADMWLGDDFHHNGALRLSYAFEYAYMVDGGKESQDFPFDRYDTYDFYLDLGPLSNVKSRYFQDRIPTWNDYVAHPDYDAFWKRQTLVPHLRDVKVPTLTVAGWWDQEDFYGPLAIYEALERNDPGGLSRLVVGPWNHGGWNAVSGDKLGAIAFDCATSKHFREEVEVPFFAHYLKDRERLDLPEALTFEAGTNRWRRWDAWPPPTGVEARPVYLAAGGSLSFDEPAVADPAFDEYLSDPAHPVPYRHRPIQATYFPGGSKWSTWLVEDQRFVDDRPDVLSFETEPLEKPLTIAGEVTARIYASTTGSDADWIVKLIDVYPEKNPEDWSLAGYQLMVSNEVFRGRYRQSFETPQPIPPGAVREYSFSLHTQNYAFLKGHRVMVQVQSSWFPLIDRNPQTFVPNIFAAKAEDFRAATHRVYRSARYPSHVVLPLVVGPTADRRP